VPNRRQVQRMDEEKGDEFKKIQMGELLLGVVAGK
jgi:hypothetical protein